MRNSIEKTFIKIIGNIFGTEMKACMDGVVHSPVLLRKLNRQNEDSPAYAPWILKLDFETETWSEETRKITHLSY